MRKRLIQKVFRAHSPLQTKKIGRSLAKEILKVKLKKTAFVLGLEGDLGGGKTTFLQGFARGLGIKEKILSPTFVLMKKFRIPNSGFQNFYHFDCYRIQRPKEILNLGFKKIISGCFNIVALEWADKVKNKLPKDAILIKFRFIGRDKREIIIKE